MSSRIPAACREWLREPLTRTFLIPLFMDLARTKQRCRASPPAAQEPDAAADAPAVIARPAHFVVAPAEVNGYKLGRFFGQEATAFVGLGVSE